MGGTVWQVQAIVARSPPRTVHRHLDPQHIALLSSIASTACTHLMGSSSSWPQAQSLRGSVHEAGGTQQGLPPQHQPCSQAATPLPLRHFQPKAAAQTNIIESLQDAAPPHNAPVAAPRMPRRRLHRRCPLGIAGDAGQPCVCILRLSGSSSAIAACGRALTDARQTAAHAVVLHSRRLCRCRRRRR